MIISPDFEKTVMCTPKEQYLLYSKMINDREVEYFQQDLQHLAKKNILQIIPIVVQEGETDVNHFQFVCCSDFDQSLQILQTNEKSKVHEIKRYIDYTKVHIYELFHEEGKAIHLISNLDEEFFVETINLTYHEDHSDYEKYSLKNYNGYSIRWPYVTFQSIQFKDDPGQKLWIINANQQDQD